MACPALSELLQSQRGEKPSPCLKTAAPGEVRTAFPSGQAVGAGSEWVDRYITLPSANGVGAEVFWAGRLPALLPLHNDSQQFL